MTEEKELVDVTPFREQLAAAENMWRARRGWFASSTYVSAAKRWGAAWMMLVRRYFASLAVMVPAVVLLPPAFRGSRDAFVIVLCMAAVSLGCIVLLVRRPLVEAWRAHMALRGVMHRLVYEAPAVVDGRASFWRAFVEAVALHKEVLVRAKKLPRSHARTFVRVLSVAAIELREAELAGVRFAKLGAVGEAVLTKEDKAALAEHVRRLEDVNKVLRALR